MNLEAIVLAAGDGERLTELTRERPKCLLPVGNQSLIWFSITGLRYVGVSRIIVLVSNEHESKIRKYCDTEFKSYKDLSLEFIPVDTTAEDSGTAKSILAVKDKIRGDFIVHSCDTIVDPKALSFLVNHYRLYDPMLSMLLVDNAKYFSLRKVPGKQEEESLMRDIFAVEPLDRLELTAHDGYSANKVVFLHYEGDLKNHLKIRNRELALHPSLGVYSSFLDTHIYIFKHQMLDFLQRNDKRGFDFKGELLPLLIANQFNKLGDYEEEEGRENPEVNISHGSRAIRQVNYEMELKEKLENFNPRTSSQSAFFRRANIPKPRDCHGLVVRDHVAYRVNNIGSYLDSNCISKNILNLYGIKNRHSIKECLIGENTTLGSKCVVKRGSIGNNCKIGDKVKLFDCIIMDKVEIGSNTSLDRCIVGPNCKIGTECVLKLCIVGHNQAVPSGRKAKSEVIIDDSGHVMKLGNLVLVDSD